MQQEVAMQNITPLALIAQRVQKAIICPCKHCKSNQQHEFLPFVGFCCTYCWNINYELEKLR